MKTQIPRVDEAVPGRHRAPITNRIRRYITAVLAVVVAFAGLTFAGPSSPASADGEAGAWVNGNGLYTLNNAATGGPTEVACIDAGRAAPSSSVNTVKANITAPKLAYLLYKYTPGKDATTKAAIGYLAHISAEVPHDNKNTPTAASAPVASRANQLTDEANKYAGPYTVKVVSTTNPTATSGTVKKTFTVVSKAGFGVAGVKVSFAGTGSAKSVSPASGTTSANGQIVVSYSLANSATGGVKATASGLAGTTVAMYSPKTAGSGYQRVVGKGGPSTAAASATATRPAVPNGQIRVSKVSKTSTGTLLAGAVIDIRKGSATGAVVKTVTTVTASAGVLVSLPPGVYYATERTAPSGYLKDAAAVKVTVTSGNTAAARLADSPKGKFSLVKVDKDTRARLAGVKFHAEKDGNTLVKFTTDGNGSYTSPFLDLPVGAGIKIVEDTPKAGYDGHNPVYVTLTRDGTGAGRVVVENTKTSVPRGKVSVIKTDEADGHRLAGAKFKVTSGGVTIATGTTDANGVWTSPALTTKKIGDKVVITETAAPEGYELDTTPHTVTITAAGTGTARITMTNGKKIEEQQIMIEKVSSITGARLGGVQFRIEIQQGGVGGFVSLTGGALAGTYVDGLYTTATSGVNLGRIRLEGSATNPVLETGDVVRATEIASAPGYLLPLDLADRVSTGTIGEDDHLTIRAVNSPKRTVEVTKVSAVDGKPLAGATLVACYQVGDRDLAEGEAAAQTPCAVPGGPLTDLAGAELDLSTWFSIGDLPVTGADGTTTTAASDWVRPGDRVLVAETAAPAGYSLSTVAAVTTVTPTGWDPECTNHTGVNPGEAEAFEGSVIACTFADQPKTKVTITKTVVDADGQVIPTVFPAGAKYRITTAAGDVLVAETPATGEDGLITLELEGLTEGQVLTFTETDSPLGAALDTTAFTGTVVATDDGTYVLEVAQADVLLEIGTTATDEASCGKTITPGGKIRDAVSYTGLVPGKEYTVNGTLQGVGVDGGVTDTGITATATFTPTTTDGIADVIFTLPADITPGTYVVFEKLLLDGKVIATHEVPESPEQTVFVPGIGTQATGPHGDKFLAPGEKITDTIGYTGLIPGVEHTATGELYTVVDGKAAGTGITAETTFTPETSAGQVKVTFTLPKTFPTGQTVVVYEDLTVAGKVIATHRNPTDEGQTVYVPEIRTQATDQTDGDKTVFPGGTVIDKVSYSGLHIGKTYTVTGELMEKVGTKQVHTGIFGKATFVAKTSAGSVDVAFKIPASFEIGRTLVAFETVSYEGRTIAIHADINDVDQTVYVPSVGTSAVDQADGDKFLTPGGTVVDTILYAGLTPGVEHTATGELMVVVDGKATGTGITGKTVFTPKKSSGSVQVKLTIPADFVPGKTLVVFEDITAVGKVVASHKDATDEGQTVYVPKVATNAADQADGDKIITPGGTVVDTVDYSGLKVGHEYTVTGELMAKGTNGTVTGTGITGKATFKATAPAGQVKVTFTLPATITPGGYVVYEDLLINGKVIADHRVPDSSEQSFEVPTPSGGGSGGGGGWIPTGNPVLLNSSAGSGSPVIGISMAVLGLLIAAAAVGFYRRTRTSSSS